MKYSFCCDCSYPLCGPSAPTFRFAEQEPALDPSMLETQVPEEMLMELSKEKPFSCNYYMNFTVRHIIMYYIGL